MSLVEDTRFWILAFAVVLVLYLRGGRRHHTTTTTVTRPRGANQATAAPADDGDRICA